MKWALVPRRIMEQSAHGIKSEITGSKEREVVVLHLAEEVVIHRAEAEQVSNLLLRRRQPVHADWRQPKEPVRSFPTWRPEKRSDLGKKRLLRPFAQSLQGLASCGPSPCWPHLPDEHEFRGAPEDERVV
jgi:hypothetical protein